MRRTSLMREREARTRSLVAVSARRRDAVAAALAPLHVRVQRFDRVAHWMQATACWVGLAAGLGVGLLPRAPRTLMGAVSVFARMLPLWRALGRSGIGDASSRRRPFWLRRGN